MLEHSILYVMAKIEIMENVVSSNFIILKINTLYDFAKISFAGKCPYGFTLHHYYLTDSYLLLSM